MPTALVTGTSSGFGRATAERLAALGWTVIAAARDLTRDLVPAGCEAVQLDLRSDAAIAACGRMLDARPAGLDALVSNAGHGLLGPLEELTVPELRAQLEVNLIGTIALVKACIPALRRAGGVVVQVSSVSGRLSGAGWGAYAASKFGLEAASEALREELEPQGVRVAIVEPGPFKTPIITKSPQAVERGRTGAYAQIWGDLDEFARYLREDAEEPVLAVDAIIAAVTDPACPFRLPVGSASSGWLRESLEAQLAELDAAEAFLADRRRTA